MIVPVLTGLLLHPCHVLVITVLPSLNLADPLTIALQILVKPTYVLKFIPKRMNTHSKNRSKSVLS